MTGNHAAVRVSLRVVTDGLPPFDDVADAPASPSAASRPRSAGRRKGAHFAPKPAGNGRRRRWPRRLAIGAGALVVLLGALVVSGLAYARYQYDQIPKVKIKSLTKQSASKPGAPFDILLVGSDSRSFVDNSQLQNEFGSASTQSGQRSDVIIIARVVPATRQVMMLSIPRDTYVNIPGHVPYVSGMNRINVAFNSGPDMLVQTIQDDFGIPINHFVEVNFQGFSGIVDSLGGIYLDFTTPVYDKMSGLKITHTGCQLLKGGQALSLVRSRDEYYQTTSGGFEYDGMGDWSRIRRQDAFFHAVIARVDSQFTNPFALNSFISATVQDVKIDDTLGEGELISIANEFRGLGQKALSTEVLPTTPAVLNGADVLFPAQPYSQRLIAKFLAFGSTAKSGHPGSSGSGGPTSTTAPAILASQVSVQVLNGNGTSGAANTAATALRNAGFTVSSTGDAASFTYSSNEVEYGPSGLAAAQLLQSSLTGGATLVPDSSLSGSSVILVVGSHYAGVSAPGSGTSTSTTTTTTLPTSAANVVFDNPQTLPEPWDPTPCNP